MILKSYCIFQCLMQVLFIKVETFFINRVSYIPYQKYNELKFETNLEGLMRYGYLKIGFIILHLHAHYVYDICLVNTVLGKKVPKGKNSEGKEYTNHII